MTTKVHIGYTSGNKDIQISDGAAVVATLRKPGDEFEMLVHSDTQFTVAEHGEFRSLPADEAAKLDDR